MSVQEIQQLLDSYAAWLRHKTTLRGIEDWVEITTPYLDRHNDCLQIYARRDNGGFILTDDGYTLSDLELSGCRISSGKRHELLKTALNGFGVQLKDGQALQVHASAETFPAKKHNLVQAMLAVNDLFYLATPNVASLFYEDVLSWLEESDIRYTSNVKFTGKSGFDHHFDFVIPKSRQQPERILKVINRPNRETAVAAAFAWADTKEVRASEARALALLNDTDAPVRAEVADALREWEVIPVLWSKRDETVGQLAA